MAIFFGICNLRSSSVVSLYLRFIILKTILIIRYFVLLVRVKISECMLQSVNIISATNVYYSTLTDV